MTRSLLAHRQWPNVTAGQDNAHTSANPTELIAAGQGRAGTLKAKAVLGQVGPPMLLHIPLRSCCCTDDVTLAVVVAAQTGFLP